MCQASEVMASSCSTSNSAAAADAWAPPKLVCETVPARAASIAAPAVLSAPGAAEAQDHYGRRLVFFNTDAELGDDQLRAVFARHGELTGLSIVRTSTGQSCGCGHVTFASAEDASAALAALQGSDQGAEAGSSLGLLLVEAAPPGCSSPTLSVLSAAAAAARGEPHKMSRTVFFTKVPPMVTSDQLLQLFAAVGEVVQLELFIPWPGAKISKGCGLVEYAVPATAAAAVHSLNHRFTWPHSHSALVVEWVDRTRQSANSKAGKAAARAAAAAVGAGAGVGAASQRMYHHPQFMPGGDMGPPRMAAFHQQQQQHHAAYGMAPQGLVMPHGMLGAGPGAHSCPLPQLPPGWQVLGTTQALPAAAAVLHPQQQQQQYYAQQPQLVQPSVAFVPAFGAHQHYQQHQPTAAGTPGWASDTSSAHTYASVPATAVQSGSVGGGSGFDLTSMGQGSGGSSSSSASMLQVLSSGGALWDPQQGKLVTTGSLAGGSLPMQQVPEAAPLAGAPANDGVWQQLLQQNVMLLQAMNSPAEEELAANLQQQCSLLPQASAAVPTSAGLLQHLSMSNAMVTAPQQLVLQQQQLPLTQQPQQEVSVALPLSQRQVAAMASVLPELPRLTGAQAYISTQVAGGLALVLSGTSAQLQAAYATAGMLLAQCGVTEALSLPMA